MPFTYLIIGFTCIISYFLFKTPEKKTAFIHHPYSVKHRKEYLRLFSNGFIHADLTHLLFNMLTLFFFGELVEGKFEIEFGPVFGKLSFLLFYLSAIVFSCIPSQLKHQDNQYYGALGASGAVSAVLFIAIIMNPTSTLLVYFIPVPAWILGILYIWYSSYASKNRQNDNIGHDAHLFGAIYGCIVMLLMDPQSYPRMIKSILAWLS